MTTVTEHKTGFFDRLYTGEGGIDFIGRTKQWYIITAVLVLISIGAIAVRGFDMSIDFEGGTKLNMPAAELTVSDVEKTFTDATGVTPELTQVVGSGDTATLEINSQRLSDDQIQDARRAIFEKFQPKDATGKPSPDAVGDSTVSESWGSTITNRMLISMVVFLAAAFAYIAVRLQRQMAAAAMIALLIDAVLIAGIYALFGFEVSPAAIIGLLTVLSFSVYDTVIVFDKVRENTEGIFGSRKQTYAEAANSAVNETVMRSISTSVISALPIVALMVVAVWMLGVGDLKDLALIQLIGVVEGVFSSIFLATPVLVSLENRRQDVQRHNEEVARYRAGEDESAEPSVAAARGRRVVGDLHTADYADDPAEASGQSRPGASWRPGL
ncbi:protein translocase subunit SecF [Corynebacterium uberis]|uniref:protein translocase subunit SecF n=1 Tax=Corynebacterium TaxID=1716 RepID=UPI001D0BB71D|nr:MULTISPECIES: protein translocase subunit SecF [Corynebacterium]MCZ9308544.1 protein translocase subunit SecF [Corynebacterium sp. c6VSa_13]UDL74196.1 protein translocase subunit SecF [Corynebacterium uberis]UDL74921.1 protein translocase subunit SecF [Corynebacterium uberis]UDL77135.1 protein translocase subunit SecF [Corynebacterium uberis]UDL79418.1 protein translocase subunit SecF [Corynebacterium uberis]